MLNTISRNKWGDTCNVSGWNLRLTQSQAQRSKRSVAFKGCLARHVLWQSVVDTSNTRMVEACSWWLANAAKAFDSLTSTTRKCPTQIWWSMMKPRMGEQICKQSMHNPTQWRNMQTQVHKTIKTWFWEIGWWTTRNNEQQTTAILHSTLSHHVMSYHVISYHIISCIKPHGMNTLTLGMYSRCWMMVLKGH